MTQYLSEFRTLEFYEFPFKNYLKQQAFKLDVTSFGTEFSPDLMTNQQFDKEAYCFCLMKKICEIDKYDLLPFFQYQIAQLKQPKFWINTLDNLIQLNKEILTKVFCEVKLERCKSIVETLRDIHYCTIEGKPHEATKFSITGLQEKLSQCSDYDARQMVIIDVETDFKLSAQRNLLDYSCFQNQIDLEKQRLSQMKSLKLIAPEPTIEPEEHTKTQIKGNINQLADAYFQLSYEHSLIDFDQRKLAKFLVSNYTDKYGNELSLRSIETMLDPNRPEKRPPGHRRLQFDLD